ncbi:MAG: glycoside hydrolase family 31 protein [Spirochaetia bacterium]|nr:glycoside hydrolase family 31 protein [Spirochaetia bacterium]
MKTRLGAGRWWGGVATDGMRMPYGNGTGLTLDLASHGSHGQASPFYVSDDGRYLCSPKSPFSLSIGTDGNLEAEGMNLLAGKGEGTLKSGYQKACWRYFPPTGKCPPAIFFSKPQFSTWMEYFYDLDQEKVLAFATRILEEGYQPGIFIIDDGWMSFYGSFEFDLSRFPDPGKLIRNLHEMGFVVLVWASPFVSTDSVAFRNLEDGAVLLKDKDGEIAIRRWWNGCSALVDLTGTEGQDWMSARLTHLHDDFGIDGFKFDGGDQCYYHDDDQPGIPAVLQSKAYGEFCTRYPYNEVHSCYDTGGRELVQSMCDVRHSWSERGGIASLVPYALAAGLMGYWYFCPGMVAGGQYLDFTPEGDCVDEELFIRFAQCAALMPMIQFSAAPWRLLSAEGRKLCLDAAMLHQRFAPYICEEAKKTSLELQSAGPFPVL